MFFLMFRRNFLCFNLCLLPLVLSLGTTEKSLAPAAHSPCVAEPEQGQMASHALACAMSALCVYVHSFSQPPFTQHAGHALATLPIPNPVKMFILVTGGLQ